MLQVKVKVKGHAIRALLCCHENRRRRGGLLYVLTVYPAESWAPLVRAHELLSTCICLSICLSVPCTFCTVHYCVLAPATSNATWRSKGSRVKVRGFTELGRKMRHNSSHSLYMYIHCAPENAPFYYCNNFVNCQPIFIIFDRIV